MKNLRVENFLVSDQLEINKKLFDMTIPIPNKESMACLQTSKTKFMITDILSGGGGAGGGNSETNNNKNGVSPTTDHHHSQQPQQNHHHHPPVPPPPGHLAAHLSMLQRESFAHHQMLQAGGRMSSPEYDDGASDCDSDEMNDDNSVCSNGK